jgi:hypothetical protein
MRPAVLLSIGLMALAAAPVARQQTAKPTVLPPISYVCPMAGDEDVVEDQPGKCRKCGMQLEAIRLDSAWTCPVHAAVVKDGPGKCPLDGRDLVQVTMSVSWACPSSKTESITPGACPDGSPMAKKYAPRAHGNHNPQHGGLFFMAPDNWHHLEGTYPSAGLFRVYLYDDFTKPLSRDQARKVSGQVVVQTTDPATGTTKDVAAFPLAADKNGRYLEAKVGKVSFPAQMAAKVKFQPSAPEHRFDFVFPTYSKEPVAPSPRLTENAAPAAPVAATPATAAPAGALTPAPAEESASGVDPGLIPLPIPDSVPEMLTQLSQRSTQIRRFIDQGAFANVYVPAFQAKDLALALDERTQDLTAERRKVVEPAIKRLVRAAWLLDAFGDLGNKEQITAAYSQFAAAVKDVESAFPNQ